MNRLLLTATLVVLFSCSKSNDKTDDMKRELTVWIMAVRSTAGPISNNWEIHLQFNKAVSQMAGNAIVQHELWDRGQFKATYIDTFNFDINNSNAFAYRTNRNANLQGPEIKNIKVNKFTQTTGGYTVTIK